jgi:hypothetical protein
MTMEILAPDPGGNEMDFPVRVRFSFAVEWIGTNP